MKNETTIATWQDYAIVKVKPKFSGPHFYYIARNGHCISRTFNTKSAVTKALRLLQSIQPYPILDAKIYKVSKRSDTPVPVNRNNSYD